MMSSSGDPQTFSRLLDRTRQNIQKISQKYSSDVVDPIRQNSRSYGTRGVLYGSQIASVRTPSSCRGVKENLIPSESQLQEHRYREVPTPLISQSHVNIEEALLNRLSRLESLFEALTNNNTDTQKRVSALESTVDVLKHNVETLTAEVREGNRMSASANSTLIRQSGQLDSLLSDNENKRGAFSKMESWVRQNEQWREEIEQQTVTIQKTIKSQEKKINEFFNQDNNFATKADIESMKDKMHVITQQSVATSMSVWHEKVEAQMRVVERQMAAIRMGSGVPVGTNLASVSAGGSGVIDMSPEEISNALSTPYPSELLLKSLISSEVREVEVAIERKVEAHVKATMRGEVAEAQKTVRTELRDYVGRIAAELGLTHTAQPISSANTGDEGGTIAAGTLADHPAARAMAMRKGNIYSVI